MSEQTVNTKIKNRVDTYANWSTANPVLLAGEMGVESDTHKIKIGDGVTLWNNLSYIGGSGSSSSSPVTINATLASGSTTTTISDSNITANSLVIMGVPTTATKAQIQMLGAAMINCTSQTAGSITLTALGAAPTADIPITLTVVG